MNMFLIPWPGPLKHAVDAAASKGENRREMPRTVDGDSNALGEEVAVAALKSRDAAQFVELAVVVRDTLARVGVDKLDVEVVGLRDGEQRHGARVALQERCQSSRETPLRARRGVPLAAKLEEEEERGGLP